VRVLLDTRVLSELRNPTARYDPKQGRFEPTGALLLNPWDDRTCRRNACQPQTSPYDRSALWCLGGGRFWFKRDHPIDVIPAQAGIHPVLAWCLGVLVAEGFSWGRLMPSAYSSPFESPAISLEI
jgi:hypothetical protein